MGTWNVLRMLFLLLLLIHVQDGMTPLYIASWKGHGAVVKVLLQQHADVSISKTVIFHQ